MTTTEDTIRNRRQPDIGKMISFLIAISCLICMMCLFSHYIILVIRDYDAVKDKTVQFAMIFVSISGIIMSLCVLCGRIRMLI